MLFFCLLIWGLTSSSPCAAAPRRDYADPQSVLRSSTKNKLLLISFDGFRWDYERHSATPNLDKMTQDGVKAKYVTPPFLTITSPSHFTMLTGKNTLICNIGVNHVFTRAFR